MLGTLEGIDLRNPVMMDADFILQSSTLIQPVNMHSHGYMGKIVLWSSQPVL